MRDFFDVIRSKQAILSDGAIGTELYKRGLFINKCFEEAVIGNKDLVLSLHKDYANSGAKILTTNSWGANRKKLGCWP